MRALRPARLVRPTGVNAALQAARLGPADGETIRTAAAVLYGDEQLVFGQVQAHRLRLLAERLERGESLVDVPAAPEPSVVAEVVATLNARIEASKPATKYECSINVDGGEPERDCGYSWCDRRHEVTTPGTPVALTTEEAHDLIRVLKQFDASLGMSLENAEKWEETAVAISNLREQEQARESAHRDGLAGILNTLARDAEQAESIIPGIQQRVTFAFVSGDDPDAIDVALGTELALALLSEVDS